MPRIFSLLFLCSLPWMVSAATNGVWIAEGDGNWMDPANWENGEIPEGENAVAHFPADDAERTITLPVDGITIGSLKFGSGIKWNFIGDANLTLLGNKAGLYGERGTITFQTPILAPDGFICGQSGKNVTFHFLRPIQSEGKISIYNQYFIIKPQYFIATDADEIPAFLTTKDLDLPYGYLNVQGPSSAAQPTFLWNLTESNTLITASSSSSSATLLPGQPITAEGLFPSGTYVKRVHNGNQVELSAPALLSCTTSLTFHAYTPRLHGIISNTLNTKNGPGGMTASLELQSGDQTTIHVGKLEGGDNLRLSGSGRVEIQDTSAFQSGVRLDAGVLAIQAAPKKAPAFAPNPALHFDASEASSLVLDTENNVLSWTDLENGEIASVITNNHNVKMHAPRLLPNRLNGQAVVDFREFGEFGASLGWSKTDTNICSVFIVMNTEQKGGFFLGFYDHDALQNIYDFHRSGEGSVCGGSYYVPWALTNVADNRFINGKLYADGVRIRPLTEGADGGWQLYELVMDGPCIANAFCHDRNYGRKRAGGQEIAEVLIYDRTVTEEERKATANYLHQKWFGSTLYVLPGETHLGGSVTAKQSTNIAIDIAPTSTLSVVTLGGSRDIPITGGGTLEIRQPANSTATPVLKDGTISLLMPTGDLAPMTNPCPNIFFHVDASRPETIITNAAGAVLEWRDTNYAESGLKAVVPPAPTVPSQYPVYLHNGLNGLPTVDFGSTGSGRCLLWNHTNTNIRTFFFVYSRLQDTLDAFLLGDVAPINGTPHFHRGCDGAIWYAGAIDTFKEVPSYLNGISFPLGEQVVFPETPTVWSAIARDDYGSPTASAFCVDRWGSGMTSRMGGSALAEVLIYTNRLTYAQRRDVEAFLMRKWLHQPAPGTRLNDDHLVQGISALKVKQEGNAKIDVQGLGTMEIPALSGTGTLKKSGTATLAIGNADAFSGQLQIEEGDLKIGGNRPLLTEATLPGGMLFHLDASNLGSLSTEMTNDETRVTTVRDADGRNFFATQTNVLQAPVLTVNALNGRPILDFGTFGSGKWMAWSQQLTTIRTVFWVIGSQNGGGFILGGDAKYGKEGDDNAAFHRAEPWNLPLGKIWRGNAASVVKEGQLRQNGIPVNGLTTPLSGEYEILSLRTTGNTRASCFAGDRGWEDRTGGQRLAEVLIFSRDLSDLEIQDVEAYLRKKWFDKETNGYEGSQPTVQTIGSGSENGAIQIEQSLTIGGADNAAGLVKAGSGVLEIGSLSTLTGALVIVEGGIRVAGASLNAPPVTNGLAYRIDASKQDSLVVTAEKEVVSLQSLGEQTITVAPPEIDNFKGPVLIEGALNGRSVFDFGKQGSLRCLLADQHIDNIRTLFLVFGSKNGGGFLLGDKIASDSHRVFHRNNTGGYFNFSTPILHDYPTSKPIFQNGVTRLDNVDIEPRQTGFNGGWQLVEMHTGSAVHFQGHGFDRLFNQNDPTVFETFQTTRTGGQMLGEVLAYDRLLPLSERNQVYQYLRAKWWNEPAVGFHRSPNGATATSCQLAAGSWIDLAGDTLRTAQLSGSGSVQNGTVYVIDTISPGVNPQEIGLLQVHHLSVAGNARYLMDYNGSDADTVSCSGTLTFEGGMAVELTALSSETPPTNITLFTYETLASVPDFSKWTITGEIPNLTTPKLFVRDNKIVMEFCPQGTLLLIR